MVELQIGQVDITIVIGTVVVTLRRCHVLGTQTTEDYVHHVARSAVVGVGAVRVVYLDGDEVNGNGVLADSHLVLCEQCHCLVIQCEVSGSILLYELVSRQLWCHDSSAGLVGLVVGRAILLGEIVSCVLDGSLRRGRTLIATAHVGGDEVAPWTARVAIGQRDVVVRLGRRGVIQCGHITAVERSFNQVRHTLGIKR